MLDPVLKGSAAGRSPRPRKPPPAPAPLRSRGRGPRAARPHLGLHLAGDEGRCSPTRSPSSTRPCGPSRPASAGPLLATVPAVYAAQGRRADRAVGCASDRGLPGPHDLGPPGRRRRARRPILTYTMPFWLLLMAWVFSGGEAQGVPMGRGRSGARRAYPRAGPLGDEGWMEPLPGHRRRPLLGGQRDRRQAVAQAARGRSAFADRLATAPRVASPWSSSPPPPGRRRCGRARSSTAWLSPCSPATAWPGSSGSTSSARSRPAPRGWVCC